MPRKAFVKPEVMLDALKKCKPFHQNQQLKCRSDEVWEEACKMISDTLLPNTLNFYVRNNRWNLKEDLEEYFNIPKKEETAIDSINTSSESNSSQEYQSYNFSENVNTKLSRFWFDLQLFNEQWKSIYPVSKVYKEKGTNGKRYKVLKRGWTDIISKTCFLKNKLPCAYVFKYGKVFESREAEIYLKIYGFCKECGAIFKAHTLFEPAPDIGIIIKIHTVDTSAISHEDKRAVKGNARITIEHELLNKQPRQWRNDFVKDLSYEYPEPLYLPRQCTLRKIKEEAVIRELGTNKSLDPINSLTELKYKGKYMGYIKEISKEHFYCFYLSPMQMDLYKILIKKFRKIEIDATGKLMKPIVKINGVKVNPYFYMKLL